jgi:hypothetical protein
MSTEKKPKTALTGEFGGASAHRGMVPASDVKIDTEVGSKPAFITWFLSVEVFGFPLKKRISGFHVSG